MSVVSFGFLDCRVLILTTGFLATVCLGGAGVITDASGYVVLAGALVMCAEASPDAKSTARGLTSPTLITVPGQPVKYHMDTAMGGAPRSFTNPARSRPSTPFVSAPRQEVPVAPACQRYRTLREIQPGMPISKRPCAGNNASGRP